MSDKAIPQDAARHFLCSLAIGTAAAGAALLAFAALMARRGLSLEAAAPLSAAAICAGSFSGGWVMAFFQKHHSLVCGAAIGAAFALALLIVRFSYGGAIGTGLAVHEALAIISGTAGGVLYSFAPARRRR